MNPTVYRAVLWGLVMVLVVSGAWLAVVGAQHLVTGDASGGLIRLGLAAICAAPAALIAREASGGER